MHAWVLNIKEDMRKHPFRLACAFALIVVSVTGFVWRVDWPAPLLWLLMIPLIRGERGEKGELTPEERIELERNRAIFATNSDELNLENQRRYANKVAVAVICVTALGIGVLVLLAMM